ncbi:MAG TPA: hypothetical protein VFF81_00680 [Noviherbaspirillum sp.]|nr:hypothetical protein [Noviherbaspirillum sp.]
MDERNVTSTTVLHAGGAALRNSSLRTGSIVEQALARLAPEQLEAVYAKAIEEAARLENLESKKIQEFQESQRDIQLHIDAVTCLTMNGGGVRNTVTTNVKTATGNMRIETKPTGLLSRLFG